MISTNIIPKDLQNLIENLNDQAYKCAYPIWSEADKIGGKAADVLKEDAFIIQCVYFRKLFDQLDNIKKKKIFEYIRTDKNFSEQFNNWYDKNLVLVPTLDDDTLDALDLAIDSSKNKWFLNWLQNQDALHSYLAKYQIEWIINETEIYFNEMSELLKKNKIEQSDFDDAKHNLDLIKKFFSVLNYK